MLSIRLDEGLMPGAKPLKNIGTYEESVQKVSRKRTVAPEIAAKALELTKAAETNKGRLEAIYDLSLRRSPQLISRSGQRGLQRDQQTRCSQLATRLLKTS